MSKPKLKSRKEAIEIVRSKGEPIEPNEYCETLIQAAIDDELQELLNDTEDYPLG